MAPPPAPTAWVLGNWTSSPSKEHPGCQTFDIKPMVLDSKDASKVGWELELKRWTMEAKDFVKLGTSEAQISVESGYLIVANAKGDRASLRLPKSINPAGPVVAIDPNHLKVTLPLAAKA